MADYCVVKTSSLGDILQAFPILSVIHAQDPDATIDWVVEKRFASVVRAHPLIHRVLEIDSRKRVFSLSGRTYDTLFDLQGNCKSALCTRNARARCKMGYSVKTAPEWPNVFFTNMKWAPEPHLPMWQQYASFACHYFGIDVPQQMPRQILTGKSRSFPENSLMVCPCSTWQNKTLNILQWSELLRQMDRQFSFHFVLVAGDEKEEETLRGLQVYLKSSELVTCPAFGDWQQMMRQMVGVVSVDSCALHLAALAAVPTFSLFGPSSPASFLPRDPIHRYYFGACPYGQRFSKRCKRLRSCPTGACLRGKLEEDILRHFKPFWEGACKRSAVQSQCETRQDALPLAP